MSKETIHQINTNFITIILFGSCRHGVKPPLTHSFYLEAKQDHNYPIAEAVCVKKFHQLLAVGRWFPPGAPVSSTRKLISSSFHRLDMTLAVAEALNP